MFELEEEVRELWTWLNPGSQSSAIEDKPLRFLIGGVSLHCQVPTLLGIYVSSDLSWNSHRGSTGLAEHLVRTTARPIWPPLISL